MSFSLNEIRNQLVEISSQRNETLSRVETLSTENEAIRVNGQNIYNRIIEQQAMVNERQKILDRQIQQVEQLEQQIKSVDGEEQSEILPQDARLLFKADENWVSTLKEISSKTFWSYVTLSHEKHIYFDPDKPEDLIGRLIPSRKIEIHKSTCSYVKDCLDVVLKCFANPLNLPFFTSEQNEKNAIRNTFFRSEWSSQEINDFKKAMNGTQRLVIWISEDETCYDFQLDRPIRVSSLQTGTKITLGVASFLWAFSKVVAQFKKS